jgi:aldehyde:ferredoxin oxidoreductase
MWIVRVNVTDKSYQVEDVPEAYQYLAGRGLTSSIVADEVDPQSHPLGPNNKLVFSPGIVTGTSAPTSARGTSWAADLAKLQIRALVVEGHPTDKDKAAGMLVSWDEAAGKPKVEFFDATEYRGKPLADAFSKIYKRFGDKIAISGTGIAGEKGYGNSGIVFNDMKNRATRYAGRGGLGAVMASKGVKFILVDQTGAPGVEIANPELFNEGRKKMIDALQTHDITKPKGGLNSYGTAVLINIMNEAGPQLPQRPLRGSA